MIGYMNLFHVVTDPYYGGYYTDHGGMVQCPLIFSFTEDMDLYVNPQFGLIYSGGFFGGEIALNLGISYNFNLFKIIGAPNLFIEQEYFTPNDDGIDDNLVLKPKNINLDKVKKWSLNILDAGGIIFYGVSGEGPMPSEFKWNGKSILGEDAEPIGVYTIVLEYTNDVRSRKISSELAMVDYFKFNDDKARIKISRLYFPADTDDVTTDMDVLLTQQYRKALRTVAEFCKKFPEYKVLIEGHANNLYAPGTAQYASTEKNEIVPLSDLRAQAAKRALLKLGVPEDRIEVVSLGSSNPVVPVNDTVNNWKNRCVEFFLIK
jgi:outer membrane protein OmpA-like peptidoglycan-associated protein